MIFVLSATSSIESVLQKCSDAYYNDGNVYILKESDLASIPAKLRASLKLRAGTKVTDAIFDKMVDWLEDNLPNSAFLKKVGAPVQKKIKAELPFPMPSLEKRKPGTIDSWLSAHKPPYVLSLKLDGSSILLVYKKNQPVKVYSRGDGITGGDITHLAPSLNIPQSLGIDAVFRGEAILPKSLFEKHWNKFYENPRAMANGITNKKEAHPGLKHLDVVVYRQYLPKQKVSVGLKNAKRLGFTVVPFVVESDVDEEYLSNTLEKYKGAHKYEIDGLVVAQDVEESPPKSNAKPANAIAFKNNAMDDHAESRVVSVDWKVTRTGLIFPTIEIEPVRLGGVTVSRASGKSAATIERLGIGPGAMISVARSGDVIPDLRAVLKKTKPQMPNVPFVWKGENVFAKEPNKSETAVIGTIQHFFTTLGVEQFKAGTIAKFIDEGYDSVAKILALDKQKFINIPGGSKTLLSVYSSIQEAIKNVPLEILMDASGVFGHGFGERRAKSAIVAFPKIMSMPTDSIATQLGGVHGWSDATATTFANGVARFKKWLQTVPGVTYSIAKPKAAVKGPMTGQNVLFTGFRDAALEAEIEKRGGTIASSIAKATILVTKDLGSGSSKASAARDKGIPILDREQFVRKYIK